MLEYLLTFIFIMDFLFWFLLYLDFSVENFIKFILLDSLIIIDLNRGQIRLFFFQKIKNIFNFRLWGRDNGFNPMWLVF